MSYIQQHGYSCPCKMCTELFRNPMLSGGALIQTELHRALQQVKTYLSVAEQKLAASQARERALAEQLSKANVVAAAFRDEILARIQVSKPAPVKKLKPAKKAAEKAKRA